MAARAEKWPAGRSPFAGIARIRSLGVAVQPLSCPRPLSLPSRRRVSPALRSVQLPRSPRRRCSGCTAPLPGAQGRKPRHAGPNVMAPVPVRAAIRPVPGVWYGVPGRRTRPARTGLRPRRSSASSAPPMAVQALPAPAPAQPLHPTSRSRHLLAGHCSYPLQRQESKQPLTRKVGLGDLAATGGVEDCLGPVHPAGVDHPASAQ